MELLAQLFGEPQKPYGKLWAPAESLPSPPHSAPLGFGARRCLSTRSDKEDASTGGQEASGEVPQPDTARR